MPSALVFKQIKPKKLTQYAFRLEALNALRKTARGMKKEFEKTVSTWSKKPDFKTEISFTRKNEPSVLVGTDNEIYGYVNDGTEPHPIFPVRAQMLRFQSGYKAKTSPKIIGSKAGGPFGEFVFRSYVEHPGTEPRDFDIEIQKMWQPRFKREMEKALSKARKKSNQAI